MEQIPDRFCPWSGAPDPPRSRYHGQVPRRGLGSLGVELADNGSLVIERLYVASLWPRVFVRGAQRADVAWGEVTADWAPARAGTRVDLPAMAEWEQGQSRTWAAVFLLAASLGLAMTGCAALAWRVAGFCLRAPLPAGALAPFGWRPWLVLLIPAVAVWLLYLAGFFPGIMLPDSVDQWRQAHEMRVRDHHPAFHTLTIRLLTLPWDSPAAVALAQILFLGVAVALAFDLLRRAGGRRAVLWAAFAATVLSPRNGGMAVALWKDVVFAGLLLLATVQLARLLLDAPARGRLGPWVALGLLWGSAPLFRHNGLLVVAGLIPATALTFGRHWRRVLVAAGLAAALLGAVKLGLYPLLGVDTAKPKHLTIIALTRVTPLLNEDVPLSEREYVLLNRIRRIEGRMGNQSVAPEVRLDPSNKVDFGYAREHRSELLGLCRSLLGRYPLVLARSYARNMDYLLWPLPSVGRGLNLLPMGVASNPFGLEMTPLSPVLHDRLGALLKATMRPRLGWLFWWPAWHVHVVILAAGIALWRWRDVRLGLVFLPVLLTLVSVALAAVTREQRYLFPLTLQTLFLVCFALRPGGPQGGPPAAPQGGEPPLGVTDPTAAAVARRRRPVAAVTAADRGRTLRRRATLRGR